MQTISKPNQTLIDVTLMTLGTLESLIAVAAANNRSITDDLPSGTTLGIPTGVATDTATLQYLQRNSIIIATARNPMPRGIGRMKIAADFVIS